MRIYPCELAIGVLRQRRIGSLALPVAHETVGVVPDRPANYAEER
jgi:hypothetical protein